jgi:dephospho-CoA kinase
MFVLGLTGSIGMGKSATAAIFRDAGIPVHDSDAAVHALYRGAAAPLVEAAFPGTLRDAEIDRARLSAYVVNDAAALARLEAIVHPLVRAARAEFVADARAAGADLIVLDIPLLFETGCEREVDAVLLVTAPEAVQKARVATRAGMTEAKLAAIIAKQMPDAEKRRRADMILDTSLGHDAAALYVRDLVAAIRSGRVVARHHA